MVEDGVAWEVLDMDFEGSECWGVAFVESFDGNHAVDTWEHGFQLCQCDTIICDINIIIRICLSFCMTY